MPLIKTLTVDKNIFIGIWLINEPLEILHYASDVDLQVEEEAIKHHQKKREFLASRLLLKQMCLKLGVSSGTIIKTAHGKPYFNESNCHFSISHTEKYAICAISFEKTVGIDIETVQDKFLTIAPKFLTPEEMYIANNQIEPICLRWCIKEAAYKWNGEKGLSFKDEILIAHDAKTLSLKGTHLNIFIDKADEKHPWALVY